VVIPAGVAHKKLSASPELGVVGAYPQGKDWDLQYGDADDRPRADQNINRVAVPATDPVYGVDGPLTEFWKK
jgi:uncharacterized protein YjlB